PAVTELHEAVVVEAEPRDVARLGGADERARGRPELPPLREVDQVDELGLEVERRLRLGGLALPILILTRRRGAELRREEVVEQLEGEVRGDLAHALLLELVDDVVATGRSLGARLAEGDARAS